MATESKNFVMREKDMQKVSSQQKVVQIAVKCGVYAFLFIMALVIVFPFYWMIISSLKTLDEYKYSTPTFWPQKVEFVESNVSNIEGLDEIVGTEQTKLTYRIDEGTYKIVSQDTGIKIHSISIKEGATGGSIFTADNLPTALVPDDDVKDKIESIYSFGSVVNENGVVVLGAGGESGVEFTLSGTVNVELIVSGVGQTTPSSINFIFRDVEMVESIAPWLPLNYYEAFNTGSLGRAFLNTIIVGIISTLLSLVITVLSAFAFARLEFKGRETVFGLMLATMMIPGELFTITNYVTVSSLGGINSYWVLIVPFLVSVFYIYLLRQNFMQIPNELYLAAKVDGTSDIKYLWKVMIPLALPTLISITILKMMGAWNTYIWPNLVTDDRNMYLITLAIRKADFSEEGIVNFPVQMAAVTLVSIPLFMVFIFLRKYIMAGVSRSGIKG